MLDSHFFDKSNDKNIYTYTEITLLKEKNILDNRILFPLYTDIHHEFLIVSRWSVSCKLLALPSKAAFLIMRTPIYSKHPSGFLHPRQFAHISVAFVPCGWLNTPTR